MFWGYHLKTALIDRAVIPAIILVFAGSLFLTDPQEEANPTSGCIESVVVGESNMGFEVELCHVGGSINYSENSILIISSVHGNESDQIQTLMYAKALQSIKS